MWKTPLAGISYMGGHARGALDSLAEEMGEHRVVLAWVYSIAFLILVAYCVSVNPSTHKVAITICGGIVSTIMTSYVLGMSYEKVNRKDQNDTTAPTPADEKAAGD